LSFPANEIGNSLKDLLVLFLVVLDVLKEDCRFYQFVQIVFRYVIRVEFGVFSCVEFQEQQETVQADPSRNYRFHSRGSSKYHTKIFMI